MLKRLLFLSLVIFISCEKPTEIPVVVPKGDEGQRFAVEVGESEVPYLVITTEGKEVKYGSDVVGRLKIY
jgi:hypothetical protein